ncbi:MAG: alpha-amylase, partial [Treponema sp.]|nr:alpha-amylase [Treponema sp.]
SAFMNMLKKEENQKYRDTVKNTIKFDPQVLKRFVNFMNNPDEETAVAQFGKGDKYFGVCTLMVTMPGLPMFGHGQIEGFEEKYGMEYTRAYRDEVQDEGLVHRHWTDIFPLMHRRYLFSGVDNFLFYDVWDNGHVNENIFAYSNGSGKERTIVFYNNKYERAQGWIKQSCAYAVKTGSGDNDKTEVSKTLSEGLLLSPGWKNYCIFREHKNNLWYVRKSDDIINQGMFVALNGFEYQVYLDVKQVEDTVEGKYAKLHELLNGRGCEDLDVAWEEYRYKDLYAMLEKFATPDFLNEMHNLFATDEELKEKKARRPVLKELFDSVKDAALAYYAKEEEVAKEVAELDEKTSKTAPSQKEKRNSKKSVTATATERWTAFKTQIEFLYESYAKQESPFEQELVNGPKGSANAPDILMAFAMVSSAGKKCLRKWGYARKLTEYLTQAGLKADGMKETFLNIFELMSVRSLNFGAASYLNSAYETAKELTYGERAFSLTGANDFNGIRWFNKEKMDLTLWYLLAAISMYSPRIMRNNIFKLYKTLCTARDGAEYQCEKFTEAIRPAKKETKAKVAVKKPAAKKTAESTVASDKKPAAKKTTAKKPASKSKTKKEMEEASLRS